MSAESAAVLYAKIAAGSGLFLLTFLSGLLPVRILKRDGLNSGPGELGRRQATLISLLSCFSGGVFLATCFLELIPDDRVKILASFHAYHLLESLSGRPLGEFIHCFGFLLMLTVEQIFLSCTKITQGQGSAKSKTKRFAIDEERPLIQEDDENEITAADGGNQNASAECLESRVNSPTAPRPANTTAAQGEKSHDGENQDDGQRVFRSFILVTALSLHSVFEGMAVGLLDSLDQVTQIVVGLCIHKAVLAFSVGVRLVLANVKGCVLVQACVLFAIMSPIGVAVGIGIEHASHTQASLMAGAVLQGIAAGTFIFITFFEILAPEFARNEGLLSLAKLLWLLIGFSIMAIISITYSNQDRTAIKCMSSCAQECVGP